VPHNISSPHTRFARQESSLCTAENVGRGANFPKIVVNVAGDLSVYTGSSTNLAKIHEWAIGKLPKDLIKNVNRVKQIEEKVRAERREESTKGGTSGGERKARAARELSFLPPSPPSNTRFARAAERTGSFLVVI